MKPRLSFFLSRTVAVHITEGVGLEHSQSRVWEAQCWQFGQVAAGPEARRFARTGHLAGADAGLENDLRTKSRLGGLPSLPDHIEWPRQTVSGTPLHFLAQIDPSTPLDPAIDDVRLPSHGMLFFFADIEEEMLWGFEDRGDQYAATRVNLPRRRGPSASLRRICPRSVMRSVRWAAAIRGASRCFRQNPCRLT